MIPKLNNLDPKKLAVLVTELITKNISDFKKTEIAGPGFINIYLSNEALVSIIKNIFNEGKHFGSTKTNLSYNVEFVSANPTGPMHVGHCRGQYLGMFCQIFLV